MESSSHHHHHHHPGPQNGGLEVSDGKANGGLHHHSVHHHLLNPESKEEPEPPDPDCQEATHSFSTVLNINTTHQSSFLPICPPHGPVAHYLTLLLTTSSVFLSAWTILGPIAAPGGTVFALLVLIVLALLGGQLIKILGGLLTKMFRVNISLPPLLDQTHFWVKECFWWELS